MEPFIQVKPYPFVICRECEFACVTNKVISHLTAQHSSIRPCDKARIYNAINDIPGLIRTQGELRRFEPPGPDTEPIPYIQPPKQDGFRCNECRYIVRSIRRVKAHYRQQHRWTNPRASGRHPKPQSSDALTPWTSGVQCQRFFPRRAGSRWFEVGRGQPAVSRNKNPEDALQARIQWLFQSQEQEEERIAQQTREMIEVADDRKEPNEWLNWVGWAMHLRGLDPNKLYATMDPIEDDEPRLALKWQVLDRVMDEARASASPDVVGRPVLFEIQRSDPEKKPRRPFTNRMEEDTWKRYKEHIRKIICIIERTELWPENKRPPYRVNKKQRRCMADWDDAIDRFIEARSRQQIRKHVVSGSFARINSPFSDEIDSSDSDSNSISSENRVSIISDTDDYQWDQSQAETQLELLGLDMLISWFDHFIGHNNYANIIISSLAIMGIQDDRQGGWHSPLDYTPIYSGIIKVARFLVLLQSWREWEAKVEKGMNTVMAILESAPGAFDRQRKKIEQDVREETQSIFSIVRAKVQRFMTRTSKSQDAEPTPIDWMFEARAMGLKIRYDTTAPGTIDWNGNVVIFRDIKFSTVQLSIMLRELVQEARELLAELAMAPADDVDQLPMIPWDKIEDTHSNTTVGYSFIADPSNGWLSSGRQWVIKQIPQSSTYLHRWIKARPGDGSPYQEKAVREYSRKFEQFRERLFMLMHMMSMPARSPEISGIRFQNTADGGVRNVFVHNGMVNFVTSYHKGFRNTGASKIIHRYMPREVGSLIVWYLWLVLPFWQKVQGSIHGGRPSPFMWADDVMRQESSDDMTAEEKSRMRQEGLEDEIGDQASQHSEDDTSTGGSPINVPQEWQEEKTWTNDRMRRILTSHSERLLGSRITISAWRQIAVAIARRYLGGAFGAEETGGAEDEDDVDPGIEDDPLDLQVGHGSLVAGIIYARELQQATFGTTIARDKFRAVSRSWHRFLGFGDDDQKLAVGMKRRREPYETARDAERMKRMRMMQMANIHGSLRSIVGPNAEFRGQQEKVIQAIMQEAGPIIQVTGTGGGKSLSFMLPAYCVPGGTTIAIVPLVALREDLHSRCREANIRTITWQRNRGNPPATIVFVTPESAISKGFRDWVNGVIAQGQLDRVVVDECHVLLDGGPEFRQGLAELGPVIQEWGVQRVFLTATLPPTDMEAFHRVAALDPERTTVFRERTVRRNIQYSVITVQAKPGKAEEAEDTKVCKLVQNWRQQHGNGRIMIYAVKRERVDRLAARLGCPSFHAQVDTVEGKVQRLREWKKRGDMIVGTKALGLGIDVPDVRLVLHAGMPWQMKDYIQESGRGGRDGQRSEAVTVCAAGAGTADTAIAASQAKGGQARKARRGVPEHDTAAAAYIQGRGCRREIIDQAMDGFTGREGCKEGEEACDVCQKQIWMEEAIMEVEASDEEAIAERAEVTATQSRFQEAQRMQATEQHQAVMGRMRVASAGASFEELIEAWKERCTVCWEAGEERAHDIEECPCRGGEDWTTTQAWMGEIGHMIFQGRGMADYSGCFDCGMPQGICQRWERVKGDEGRFQRTGKEECQYKELLRQVWAAGLGLRHDRTVTALREMGYKGEVGEEMFTWMGRKVQWGGYETNNMCVGLGKVISLVEAREDLRFR